MIKILQGNCLDKIQELDDNSIDCVVSSPPYYGLRDYGVDGQFGLEKTYQDYIANTVKVFETFKPKLKDTATIWWNVGDSYNSTNGFCRNKGKYKRKGRDGGSNDKKLIKNSIIKEKDLMMIPNRVAIALQDAGWYIRSEIIWHKPNPMPESVKDRPTSCHEKIWLIAKNKKYYYDREAIREPIKKSNKGFISARARTAPGALGGKNKHNMEKRVFSEIKGANKRNVWTVTTKPFKDAHFATFPKDLIEPCIKAGCPEKVCVECGKPYIRKIKIGNYNTEHQKSCGGNVDGKYTGKSTKDYKGAKAQNPSETKKRILESLREKIDLGLHKNCECNTQDYKPGIVLDPFGGAGTTGLVASELNRSCIMIELNPDYITMIKERLEKNKNLFNQ